MRGNVRMDAKQPGSTADQPGPAWYQTYFAAILETNQDSARAKIEQARNDVQDRILELRFNSTSHNSREIQDLDNALTYLQILLEHIRRDDSTLWE